VLVDDHKVRWILILPVISLRPSQPLVPTVVAIAALAEFVGSAPRCHNVLRGHILQLDGSPNVRELSLRAQLASSNIEFLRVQWYRYLGLTEALP